MNKERAGNTTMIWIRTNRNAAYKKEKNENSNNRIMISAPPVWLLVGPMLFLTGIALGALFYTHAQWGTASRLDFLFQTDYQLRKEEPFWTGFLSSIASSFLLVFLCFLCGLSVWGPFTLPVIPIARGFGLGLGAGYLYTAYGIRGVIFYLSVFLPGALIASMGIFLALQESWLFSKSILSGSISKTERHERFYCYFVRFGLYLLPCFAGALLDWLTAAVVSPLFSF